MSAHSVTSLWLESAVFCTGLALQDQTRPHGEQQLLPVHGSGTLVWLLRIKMRTLHPPELQCKHLYLPERRRNLQRLQANRREFLFLVLNFGQNLRFRGQTMF